MSVLGHKELSGRVIEAATAVPKVPGPGFREAVREQALTVELRRADIRHEQPKPVDIFYLGEAVGQHRPDLRVEGVSLVDLKAVSAIEDVCFAMARAPMRAAGSADGLIRNFATMPLTITRVGPGLSPLP